MYIYIERDRDSRERESKRQGEICSSSFLLLQGPPSPMITSSGSVSGRKGSVSSGGGLFSRKRVSTATSTTSNRRGSDSSFDESSLQSR